MEGANNRIVAIDGIRGLLLIIIALNHLGSVFSVFTSEPLGFVSAAAGFVFMSGLVAALAYSRVSSLTLQIKACWRRSLSIYLYHLITGMLVVTLLLNQFWMGSFWFGVDNEIVASLRPFQDQTWVALKSFAGLFYQPYLMDILPLYVIFLMSLPWVLQCFRYHQDRWVLAGSFALWCFSQGFQFNQLWAQLGSEHWVFKIAFFNILSWQFLFVLGAWVGFRGIKRRDIVVPEGRALRLGSYGVLAGLVIVGILAKVSPEVHQLLVSENSFSWAGRAQLGPLRLFNFLLVVLVFYFLLKHHRLRFLQHRALVFLGRHSLQVFAAHIPLVFIGQAWMATIAQDPDNSIGILLACNVGASILMVAVLFLVAWIHHQSQIVSPSRENLMVKTVR